MKPIEKIELDAGGGMIALSCEYDGGRYHLWLDEKTLKPKDDVLYKNPPNGCPKEDEFPTRTLSQTRGVGPTIVPAMLAQVKALLPGLRAKIRYEEDEQKALNEDYQRDEAVKEAAKDLLAALKGLLADKYLSEPINADRMTGARAAVAKAEPWREGK